MFSLCCLFLLRDALRLGGSGSGSGSGSGNSSSLLLFIGNTLRLCLGLTLGLFRFGYASCLSSLCLGLEGINVLGSSFGNEACEERIGAGYEGNRVLGVIGHKSAVGLVTCDSLFNNRYLLCFTSAFSLSSSLFGSDV